MGQLESASCFPSSSRTAVNSVWHNGLWVLPSGLFVIVGAQLGGRLIHRYGTIKVVRAGLVIYELGLLAMLRAISLHMTVWQLLPARAVRDGNRLRARAAHQRGALRDSGRGSGFASGAQHHRAQVGSALGVAVIGLAAHVQTVSHAVSRIKGATLPATVKANAIAACTRRARTSRRPEG